MRIGLFLLLLFFSSCIQEGDDDILIDNSSSYDLTAKVIYLKDGDSFVVLDSNKKELEIRLKDIDAPELYQDYGKKAKQYLTNKIKGQIIGIDIEAFDKYGRALAYVYKDSTFINLDLISKGYAWHYDRFSSDEEMAQAQEYAEANKLGLWKMYNPTPPWLWRKAH